MLTIVNTINIRKITTNLRNNENGEGISVLSKRWTLCPGPRELLPKITSLAYKNDHTHTHTHTHTHAQKEAQKTT